MCVDIIRDFINDLLVAFGGWGIIANRLAGVIYPVAFYAYYTWSYRYDNGSISRLIGALPFFLLIGILGIFVIRQWGDLLVRGQEAWENGDWLDRLGGVLLWIVMIIFFGFGFK